MDSEEHMGVTVEVMIEDFKFAPKEIRISVGDTIKWTNLDTAPHTATDNNDMFDSGTLEKGESFSMTFDEAGTYDYICTIHPWMEGTVIVEA
ncbi:cupredoxin family copper-binding protein [Methanococcoides sp. SA1]|nr:cupredoxin family copper-binding protein [Methanococcoides sp. SA1]